MLPSIPLQASILYWNPHAIPLPTDNMIQCAFYDCPESKLDFRARAKSVLRECVTDVIVLSPVHTYYVPFLCKLLKKYATKPHHYGHTDYAVIFAVRKGPHMESSWNHHGGFVWHTGQRPQNKQNKIRFYDGVTYAKSQGCNAALAKAININDKTYIFASVLFTQNTEGDAHCISKVLHKASYKYKVPHCRHIVGGNWAVNCAQSDSMRALLDNSFRLVSSGGIQIAPYDIGCLTVGLNAVTFDSPRSVREFYTSNTTHGKKEQYIWIESQYVLCHRDLNVISLPNSDTWKMPTFAQYVNCAVNAVPVWPSWCAPRRFGLY